MLHDLRIREPERGLEPLTPSLPCMMNPRHQSREPAAQGTMLTLTTTPGTPGRNTDPTGG